MKNDSLEEILRIRGLDNILCGDNCEIMRQMPSASIDLVVTSPPYDDLRKYGGHNWDFFGVAWNLKRLLKDGGVIVWIVADKTDAGSETGTSMEQALHFKKLGLNLHDTMIYASDKPPLTHNRYEQAWEYAFILSLGKPKTWNPILRKTLHGGKSNASSRYWQDSETLGGSNTPGIIADECITHNIWWYSTGNGKSGHPAPFPLKLAQDHVASWSNPGDTVLDCFAGSGTACLAAKQLNRRYVGIEVNQTYVDIANKLLI